MPKLDCFAPSSCQTSAPCISRAWPFRVAWAVEMTTTWVVAPDDVVDVDAEGAVTSLSQFAEELKYFLLRPAVSREADRGRRCARKCSLSSSSTVCMSPLPKAS